MSDDFADKYSTILNFGFVNEPDLTKILKAKIFIHKEEQLRAAHLILCYNPLSSSFQEPKCVIKVKDRHLHLINVAVLVFLNPNPTLEGVQKVEPLFQYFAKEEVVEVSNFEDDFEVFNQSQSFNR